MITYATIEEAMAEAMRRAVTTLPPDVDAALRAVRAEETDPLAVKHLDVSLENFRWPPRETG